MGLDLVTLANNHTFDYLGKGFYLTKNKLHSLAIDFCGAGNTKEIAKAPFIKEINNLKFCFLNYIDKDTNPNLPPNQGLYLNYLDLSNIKSIIKKYENNIDHFILLLHWGGKVENGFYPHYNQIVTARKLIESGIDLIMDITVIQFSQ